MSDRHVPQPADSGHAPARIAPGDRLDRALDIAFTAGELVLELQSRGVSARGKGVQDLVTEADLAAEEMIRERLLASFPEDGFVGEESDAIVGRSGYVWVVDPIDGTVNYSRGQPLFGVSVGLRGPDGEVELGVIRMPALDRTYWGCRGLGAFRNGKTIRVSSTDHLGQFIVHATDLCRTSDPQGFTSKVLREQRPLLDHILRWHIHGSAVWELCLLAEGSIDAYLTEAVHPWDVVAGWAILREAGGSMMAPDGSPCGIDHPEMIFHNGRCGDEIAAILREARR